MNLSNKDPSIHFESVTKEVAQMFCQSYAPEMNIEMVDIDPSKDEQFPGIVDLRKELEVCYRVPKVNSLSWATNKWFQGQISFFKVREKGKFARDTSIWKTCFFSGDKSWSRLTKFLLTPLFTSEIHSFFERMYFLPSLKEVWEKWNFM